jgi:hypothetical protein
MPEVRRFWQFRTSNLILLILSIAAFLGWSLDRQRISHDLEKARFELRRSQVVLEATQADHEAQLREYRYLEKSHADRVREFAKWEGNWRLVANEKCQIKIWKNVLSGTNLPEGPNGNWIMELAALESSMALRLQRDHADGFLESRCFLYRLNEDELLLCFNKDSPERYPVEFKPADGDSTITWRFERLKPGD